MRTIKTKAGTEILLPKNDFLFKLIFGDERNKDILKGFLQAVLALPDSEFDVDLLDTRLKPQVQHDKLGVLDVRVKTKSGKVIDIEMQVAQQAYIFERICFYLSKMLADQMDEGDWYDKIKKTISIVITDFAFIESGNNGVYHHCFRFTDPVDGAYFGAVEEIHTIELPKVPDVTDETAVWDWSKFIGVSTEEELSMLAAKNEVLGQAVETLRRVSAQDEVRLEYEAREKAWRDEQARTAFALQSGFAQGRAEGRAESRTEILALIRQGYSADEIERRYK
ncbi:MAG: Rpn family recombination-promoting nuclease/putative transposase [Spirochaetaceae bacterium]|jgi:predicted transposase/invertase (TIGR01784 family)|nr:Rpn family recombination-promoting nuclease/putative transposase [Spirochaetaceae bacterium]